ncbi:MAG: hypothetical protein H6869_04440 [Rhodospirillales bacterium]|nr:hypothetical protein [Rhodospirillales bacterium]
MFLGKKVILAAGLLAILSGASGTALAGQDGAASVRLPVSVKILDFETTRKLCGQENAAPAWCPVHLLADAQRQDRPVIEAAYKAEDDYYREASLALRKLGKRDRIAAVKARFQEGMEF